MATPVTLRTFRIPKSVLKNRVLPKTLELIRKLSFSFPFCGGKFIGVSSVSRKTFCGSGDTFFAEEIVTAVSTKFIKKFCSRC